MSVPAAAPQLRLVPGGKDRRQVSAARDTMNVMPMRGREMVGRRAELSALLAAWDESRRTGSRLVLFGGEAGIGKSMLIGALQVQLADAQVLTGQCVPLGGEGLAYAPINGILRQLVVRLGRDTVADWAGAGWASLAPLLPSLVGQQTGPPDDGDRLRLFEAVARILEQAAQTGPLLVIIEDLHWADESTLGLLRFVARALDEAPILFVCSYRTDELTRRHPLRPFLAEMSRILNTSRLELTRLDRDDVGELLAKVIGTTPVDSVVSLISERTQGIPYFVEELATATSAGCLTLPDTLRDALSVRVQRLPDEAQHLLRLMSTGGNRIDHELLTAVSDDQQLDRHLRDAIDAQVIIADETGYEFRHSLLREVIHEDLLPGEHVALHARFAEVLERCADLLPEIGRPAIPHHWLSAHKLDKAFTSALEVARLPSVPHSEAVKLYERALEIWDQIDDPESVAGSRADVLHLAADRARYAGDPERGLALIDVCIEATPPGADPLLRSRRLCAKGRLLTMWMRPAALTVLAEAIALTDGYGATRERGHALKSLAQHQMLDYQQHESIKTATQQLEIARALGHDGLASDAHNTIACCLKALGREEESAAEMAKAKEMAHGDQKTLLRYYVNVSDSYHLQGRYRQAAEEARAGVEVASGLGMERWSGAILAGNAAEPLVALGEWEEADRLIRRGLNFLPPQRHVVHLRMLKAWLLTFQGDFDGADQLLAEYATSLRIPRAARPRQDYDLVLEQEWQAAKSLAELALARGQAVEAWSYVEPQLGMPNAHAPARMYALLFVGALAARGVRAIDPADRAEAVQALRIELDRIPRGVAVEPVWRPAIEAALDDTTESWRAAYERPMDEAEPAHLRPWIGLCLAEHLIADRDRDGAREVLASCLAVTKRLRAKILTDAITELLQRAGFVERMPPINGLSRLTARETEVLRQVAAGKSNSQIGSELFISTKTASVHVSNILAKLKVSGRGEAAAKAHASGLS